jgi:uncharacterized protein YdeI (YjbR/CyaY-like superfamily)
VDIGERLLVTIPEEWRRWLELHGSSKREIWLIFYKKTSGKQGLSYDAAVEEALCYGWIDGQMKGIDGETYALRFSPRRPRGNWSETNRALARRLIEEGRMAEAGRASLPPDLFG